MKLYNFKRLIKKYSVDFSLQIKQGAYIGGRWSDNEIVTKQMRGAIVPMSEKKIYQSGGTYTADDRELYMSEPLESDLSALKVVYKGNTYTVEQSRDYGEYADVYIYNLKRVGVAE